MFDFNSNSSVNLLANVILKKSFAFHLEDINLIVVDELGSLKVEKEQNCQENFRLLREKISRMALAVERPELLLLAHSRWTKALTVLMGEKNL